MTTGQVIELASRPRRASAAPNRKSASDSGRLHERQTKTPAQNRAVALTMSHASYVRIMELGIDLLEGAEGALGELVTTLQASITGGASPELHDAVLEMSRRRIAEIEHAS